MTQAKLNDLIALYEQRLKVIWFFEFLPILIVLGLGYKIIVELIEYKIKINPLWFFYLVLIFFSISIIGITVSLLIRFLNRFLSTIRELRLCRKRVL